MLKGTMQQGTPAPPLLWCSLQGKPDEARPLYEKALAIFRKTLGEGHQHTTMAAKNLEGLGENQVGEEERICFKVLYWSKRVFNTYSYWNGERSMIPVVCAPVKPRTFLFPNNTDPSQL